MSRERRVKQTGSVSVSYWAAPRRGRFLLARLDLNPAPKGAGDVPDETIEATRPFSTPSSGSSSKEKKAQPGSQRATPRSSKRLSLDTPAQIGVTANRGTPGFPRPPSPPPARSRDQAAPRSPPKSHAVFSTARSYRSWARGVCPPPEIRQGHPDGLKPLQCGGLSPPRGSDRGGGGGWSSEAAPPICHFPRPPPSQQHLDPSPPAARVKVGGGRG